MNFTATKKC